MSWLDQIDVAAPCRVSWDAMQGDDRTRHCGQCELQVYNLSGMSHAEAVDLVRRSQGERVCVRFYRRADGTVLTSDCPTSVRRGRKRLPSVRKVIAAGFSAAAGLGLAACDLVGASEAQPEPPHQAVEVDPSAPAPVTTVSQEPPAQTAPAPEPVDPEDPGEWFMGDVCVEPLEPLKAPEQE